MLDNIKKIFRDVLFRLRRNYKVVLLNIASLSGIVLLTINIYRIMSIGIQRYSLISTEEHSLEQLRQEESLLKKDLNEYSSLDFIESQSRDYLSLARDGDLILVIPKINIEKRSSEAKSEIDDGRETSIELWIELLF